MAKKKVNKSGVKFSQAQIDELRRLVKNVNNKRYSIRSKYYKDMPETYLKREDDLIFMPYKPTQNLNKFKSLKQYKAFIHRYKQYLKPNYLDKITRLYGANVNKALIYVFNESKSLRLRKLLNSLSLEQKRKLFSLYQDDFNIDYIYFDPEDSKLKKLEGIVEQFKNNEEIYS